MEPQPFETIDDTEFRRFLPCVVNIAFTHEDLQIFSFDSLDNGHVRIGAIMASPGFNSFSVELGTFKRNDFDIAKIVEHHFSGTFRLVPGGESGMRHMAFLGGHDYKTGAEFTNPRYFLKLVSKHAVMLDNGAGLRKMIGWIEDPLESDINFSQGWLQYRGVNMVKASGVTWISPPSLEAGFSAASAVAIRAGFSVLHPSINNPELLRGIMSSLPSTRISELPATVLCDVFDETLNLPENHIYKSMNMLGELRAMMKDKSLPTRSTEDVMGIEDSNWGSRFMAVVYTGSQGGRIDLSILKKGTTYASKDEKRANAALHAEFDVIRLDSGMRIVFREAVRHNDDGSEDTITDPMDFIFAQTFLTGIDALREMAAALDLKKDPREVKAVTGQGLDPDERLRRLFLGNLAQELHAGTFGAANPGRSHMDKDAFPTRPATGQNVTLSKPARE